MTSTNLDEKAIEILRTMREENEVQIRYDRQEVHARVRVVTNDYRF